MRYWQSVFSLGSLGSLGSLVSFFSFFTVFLFCLASPSRAKESLSTSYWIEAGLVYADHLKRPNTSSDNPPYADTFSSKKRGIQGGETESFAATGSGGSRALGLRRFLFGLRFMSFEDSSLEVTLRPDALLRRREESTATEYDGRSGSVHRLPVSIELLDLYALNLHFGSSVTLSAGVFKEIAPRKASYFSPLEFGLWTVLPQKVSGFKLDFNFNDPHTPLAQPREALGSRYTIWVYQGRRERSEYLGYKSDSFDKAPTTADANMAMAFAGSFRLSSSQSIDGVFGREDRKELSGGHVNETYASLSYSRGFSWHAMQWLLSIDAKIARERWEGSVTKQRTLTQKALSITNLIHAGGSFSIANGLHFGQSDRSQNDESLEGWQVDLGVREESRENLMVSAYVSVENRTSSVAGASDGFQSQTDATSYLMRMAFAIDYTLNQP